MTAIEAPPEPVFPKVARLDSVYGRVNLRKIYGALPGYQWVPPTLPPSTETLA